MIRWFGEKLKKKYIEQGLLLGDILSRPYLGKPVNWEKILNTYKILESKMMKKRYKPILLVDFIDVGGWGKNKDLTIEMGNQIEIDKIYKQNQQIINQYIEATKLVE